MKARIQVRLKPGVLDPQGKAIGHALLSLGFTGVGEVRQGKLIEIALAESDSRRAREEVEEMCRKLLANPVIEDYAIELVDPVIRPRVPLRDPDDLLREVVQSGLTAVEKYFEMGGDAGLWEMPELWIQTEIAAALWRKYESYIWLELPISKMLEWYREWEAPDMRPEERITGRVDIGLFSGSGTPEQTELAAIVEVKDLVLNGYECVRDGKRIRKIANLHPVHGIVGGPYNGRAELVTQGIADGLKLQRSKIFSQPSRNFNEVGFIAALVT
jgi:phosphoribosylformylglycinamidine synthase subunit PurS